LPAKLPTNDIRFRTILGAQHPDQVIPFGLWHLNCGLAAGLDDPPDGFVCGFISDVFCHVHLLCEITPASAPAVLRKARKSGPKEKGKSFA